MKPVLILNIFQTNTRSRHSTKKTLNVGFILKVTLASFILKDDVLFVIILSHPGQKNSLVDVH